MHESKNCYIAHELSVDERISKVKEKKCCLNCLETNHIAKFCKQFVRYFACGKAHLVILCPGMGSKMESPTGRPVVNNIQTTTARQICTGEVALMTLWVRIAGIKRHKNVRVLLDCDSQWSYISEPLAAELGLPIVSKENVALTLFDGFRTELKLHNKYQVGGASDEIISDKDRTAPTLCVSLAVHDFNISDLWSLEAIGILDVNQNFSNAAEEEIAHDQFLSSLTRKENGHYCMGLPWLGSSMELPSNFQVAEKRLFGITQRLRSLHKYEEYDGVFKEWLEEGVIEMVPDHELNSKGHYLPHHPDSVTTKITPLFDALCKAMFDPLGFLTPILLTAKLLIQEMWACGVGWDTPLTENIKCKFLKWYNELEVLNKLRILRCMGFGDRSF
ncbi:uncharacterized protein TNIN_394091 [Trichonephila inaurata madagascariensis]|uniref:Uncharacterized protein n=1 Tax=Trichonephila inaurata madagascariensis TaxID=2747483 RepID=A0A8X7CGQ2_9ARAC|nr:uncharacterized protein TNIN_394091 [Trichonephila inaurata madagascariensis]